MLKNKISTKIFKHVFLLSLKVNLLNHFEFENNKLKFTSEHLYTLSEVLNYVHHKGMKLKKLNKKIKKIKIG